MTILYRATLRCATCQKETEHDVGYLGGLLAFWRCTACGRRVDRSNPGLRRAYLRELRHRVRTKPARLLGEARADLPGFVRSMPERVALLPLRIVEEVTEVVFHA